MGKRGGSALTKGLKKKDRQAIGKLSKSAKKMMAGALKGGGGGAWMNSLIRANKGPTIEEQQRAKQKKNPSGPAQTAHMFITRPNQKTLLIGEGNFSFAKSLIEIFDGKGGHITATALDGLKEVKGKYPDAKENLSYVKQSGAAVLFDVDGTKLEENGAIDRPFDLIVFNFPHVGLGIKDQEVNVVANTELVSKFLDSAAPLLSPNGMVCVTVKKGEPYDQWKIPLLGLRVSTLKLKNTVPFVPEQFPGYAHRRTAGITQDETGGSDNDIMSKGAHMYMFSVVPEEGEANQKKKKGKGAPKKRAGGYNPKGGASKGGPK